ncbi:hypothetical protein BKI52_22030 [marine bacterium AO1-C]|nr:hypothetical protein BKI52_22030 [marine bacterium AO1-C]
MNTLYWREKDAYGSFDTQQHFKANISRKKFKRLRGFDLCWELLQPLSLMVGHKSYERDRLRYCSPGQKALYMYWQFDSEVTNGGFVQFFWNGNAEYVPSLLNGLDLIGDKKMSKLVEEAYAEYQQQHSVFIQSNHLTESPLYDELETLNQMDFEYFRLHKKTIDKLEKYIKRNPEEFVEFID